MSEIDDFTTPIKASQVKKGTVVLINDHPCRVTSESTSKTGKHGHAKVHVFGTDVFTGKKYEGICKSTYDMKQPILERTSYQLQYVDEDGYMQLLEDGGSEQKEDLQLDVESDLGKEIVEKYENCADDEMVVVVVLSWGYEEAVVSFKCTTF